MVTQLSHKLGSFEDRHARMKEVNLESHVKMEDISNVYVVIYNDFVMHFLCT